MKRVIVYLNQFFGQIGGEDMADHEPELREGPVGPAVALEQQLKDAKVSYTIICGDNYMSSYTENALERVGQFLADKEFDLLVAGPAFLAGRYGFNCGEVCKYAGERFKVPTITSMNENNPGVELYHTYTYIIKGHSTAAGMRGDIAQMAGLANKILAGEVLQGAEAEGYFGRGIRKEVFADGRKNAADRAVDMLLKKLNGGKYHTELLIAKEDRVEPLGPVDAGKLRVAFFTTGGLVPAGNPDRLPAGGATHWARYDIENKEVLKQGDYISVHGGYNTGYAAEAPMVVVPLDALRRHEKEGHMGSLHPYYYVTVGNQTAKGDAVRMAREIVDVMKKDGVQAIIAGST